LSPFSAKVPFFRSQYLARRAEAWSADLLGCLGRHLNLGAVSDVRGNLKIYLNASKAVASITEIHIARKVKGQSR
jgi:hypothetical protein